MTKERDIMVEGISYRVVISDEQEALLTAKAAGRAFVGVWKEPGTGAGSVMDGGAEAAGTRTAEACTGSCPEWLWEADFVVDSPETADDRFLERVVRRKLGLPWTITESERICIRELTLEDAEQAPTDELAELAGAILSDPDRLRAYIENQYGFYEYGIWAVVRKSDGRLVGTAGVSDCDILRWQRRETGCQADRERLKNPPQETLETQASGSEGEPQMQMELGYHIFRPYRRQGCAEEACRLILDYVEREYGCPVYAVVEAGNEASARLLCKLGFRLCSSLITAQIYSESGLPPCLYVRYWQ